MKVLVLDNEKLIREGLVELLGLFCPQVSEVKQCAAIPEALNLLEQWSPDLVFLDVELDNGETGFDFMKNFPDPLFQLIFVTAHEKYAVQAFKFSAIDFLTKPIDPVELQDAVDKAAKRIKNSNLSRQIQVLLEQTNLNSSDRKIVLKDNEAIFFVKVKDIFYCEADGPYTRFFLLEGNNIMVSKNLKEYEEMLSPFGFERTHHSFLVNLNRVKSFDKRDGGMLILENAQQVPVSQRKRDAVLKLLESRI